MKKVALLLLSVSTLLLVPACGWCCRKRNDCKPKCEKKCPKKCDNKRSSSKRMQEEDED